MPQGSVAAPVLLLVYRNSIDEGLSFIKLKTADDNKSANTLLTNEKPTKKQNNFNKLPNWAQTRQMSLYIEKCKILHTGYRNEKVKTQRMERRSKAWKEKQT